MAPCTSGTRGLDHFDLGITSTTVVDDDGGAFGDSLAVEELPAGSGPAQVGEGGQTEPGVQLPLITLTEPAQGALDTGGSHVPDPDEA
jgi:hypothetical protein